MYSGIRLIQRFNIRVISTMSEHTGKTKIAVLQLRCTSDKRENLKISTDLIEKAHYAGAKIVFLPECFDFVSESKNQALDLAETLDGDLITNYKRFFINFNLQLKLQKILF